MSRPDATAKAKKSTAPNRVDFVQQPSPRADEESDNEQESDVEIKVDGVPQKDETEEELERLVFGDSAGFREGLRDVSSDEAEEIEDEDQDQDGTTGLEGLDDAQVGQIALIL